MSKLHFATAHYNGVEYNYAGNKIMRWLWVVLRSDETVYEHGWATKRRMANDLAKVCMSFPEGDKWYLDYIGDPNSKISAEIEKCAAAEGVSQKEMIELHNSRREETVIGRKKVLVSVIQQGIVDPSTRTTFPFGRIEV